jgi:hypothetical protein
MAFIKFIFREIRLVSFAGLSSLLSKCNISSGDGVGFYADGAEFSMYWPMISRAAVTAFHQFQTS